MSEILRPPTLFLLLASAVLGTGAVAQIKTGGEAKPPQAGKTTVDPGSTGEVTSTGDEAGVSAEGTVIEPGGAGSRANVATEPAIPDGSSMVQGVLSLQPFRLAPAQTGEIVIVMMLSPGGNAVVLPGAHAKVTVEERTPAPMDFGVPQLDPPERGKEKTKFAGQPVYDDTLTFRIPVSIKNDAELKKYTVAAQVELALTNATTGAPLGTFRTAVSGFCPVGKPLPSATLIPGAKDTAATGGASGGAANPGAPGSDPRGGTGGSAPGAANGGGSLEAAPGSGGALADTPGLQPAVGGGGVTMVLWVGGLLALFAIVFLVLRSRNP